MTSIIHQALGAWGLANASFTLAAQRENHVYRVEIEGKTFALRLHRPSYRTNAQLRSELDWMAHLSAQGLSLPQPVATKSGEFLCVIEGRQVDLLNWLPGDTFDKSFPTMSTEQQCAIYKALGQEMAKLHLISDEWDKPDGFERPAWDQSGLVGKYPLWDRFWDNSALNSNEADILQALRELAAQQLPTVADFGLIHADLVGANVMEHQGSLALIDFDDGGWGFRLFEVATALVKHWESPHFTLYQDHLLRGYQAHRPLDISNLDLFLALRAATYVGWNITRIDEPNGRARNQRFIDTTCYFALKVL